jgi:hypothetical protein
VTHYYLKVGYLQFAKSVTLPQNGVIYAEILQLTATHEWNAVLIVQRGNRNEVSREITEVNTRDKWKTALRHAGAH